MKGTLEVLLVVLLLRKGNHEYASPLGYYSLFHMAFFFFDYA